MATKVMKWSDSTSVAKVSFGDPLGWTTYVYPQVVVLNVCTILQKIAVQYPLAFLELVKMASPVLQNHAISEEVAQPLLQNSLILRAKHEGEYKLDVLVNSVFLEWFNGNPKYNFSSKEKIQEHE